MKKAILIFVCMFGCYSVDETNGDVFCEDLMPEIIEVSQDDCGLCRLTETFECLEYAPEFGIDCEDYHEKYCTVLLH